MPMVNSLPERNLNSTTYSFQIEVGLVVDSPIHNRFVKPWPLKEDWAAKGEKRVAVDAVSPVRAEAFHVSQALSDRPEPQRSPSTNMRTEAVCHPPTSVVNVMSSSYLAVAPTLACPFRKAPSAETFKTPKSP
jgi:hypothetical protein